MKILIYAINYAPEPIGCAKYTTAMCEWLQKQGHAIRVITAVPYYPDWYTTYSWRYHQATINQVSVTHCPLWIPRKPNGIKRILHLISFAITSLWPLGRELFWHPDIIFCVAPTIVCLPAAILFSKLTKAKLLLHIQDFESDAAINLKLIKAGKLLPALETFLIRKCTAVSTISPQMSQRLLAKTIPNTIFPNWVNLNQIYPLTQNPLRKQLQIPNDTIVCLYSGTLGTKQGLEIIITAAEKLQTHNILFIICGAGPKKAYLQTLAHKLPNILWLPLQPSENLNLLLNTADIHLLPQKPAVTDLVLPSKLGNMLASGRPTIALASKDSALYDIVTTTGITVDPQQPEAWCQAIVTLAKNPQLRLSLGTQARDYAVKHLAENTILATFWTQYLTQ